MPSRIENDFSERNQQVLSGISQLQQTERELYANLEIPNLSVEERQRIINQINELSQMRIDMYSNLRNLYSSYQSNVSNLENDSMNCELPGSKIPNFGLPEKSEPNSKFTMRVKAIGATAAKIKK